MNSTIDFRRVTVTLIAAAILPAGACLGGGLGILGDFDPVDEDFERPSPAVEANGALQRECEAPEAVREDEVFERALCLCGDLQDVGQGLVTRSASHLKGRDPGLGHVGVNGGVDVVGNFDLGGSLDVAGGLRGVGRLDVDGDLISGDDVETTGSWQVGGDAWIDGDLRGVGDMEIEGDLFLTGDLKAVGSIDYNKGRLGFKYQGGPCGCGADEVIDVAAEVASRRDNNDNDLIDGGIGAATLTLGDGEFYFANPGELVGSRSIVVKGRAAIFVEGDIETVGDLSLQVEDGAEVDLWVSGTVSTVGNLTLAPGSEGRARAFKLYMGGAGESLVNVGNATLVGAVYAPRVDIEYVGSLTVKGSLFANNLRGTGNLVVEYDTDITAPDTCVEFFSSDE